MGQRITLVLVLLLPLVVASLWMDRARATPLYSVRSASACNTCHVEPTGWSEGALRERRCTLGCGACHVSPTGGGMRTPAGSYFAQQILPRAGRRPAPDNPAGNSAFSVFRGFSGWEPGPTPISSVPEPYGSLDRDPGFDWGFDFRGAAFYPLEASDRDSALFPMQADLYLLGRPLSHLSLYGSIGAMGSKDRTYDDLSKRTGFQQVVAAREVFVMADRLPYNSYVRGGRFAPPFGLRIPDHTSFVRRELGFDQNRQVFGVEGGMNPNYPYVNLAVFYQGWDAWPGDVEDEGVGFAATSGYRDLAGQVGLGVQGLDRFHDQEGIDRELSLGVFWGLNLFPVTYLGELDWRTRSMENAAPDYRSAFLYQELNWELTRGLDTFLKYDWLDLDVGEAGDQVHRGTCGLRWNPYTAIQVEVQYRKTLVPDATDEQDVLVMLHAHL